MPFRTIARLNPAKPKAGEEFRLQVVAQHPNEPGTRRDAEGKLIPAKYINLVEVYFEGEKVAEARPGPSTSANPSTPLSSRRRRRGPSPSSSRTRTGTRARLRSSWSWSKGGARGSPGTL